MERLVILGLGLAGEYGAASIVIAAKGLLRFPEIQAAALPPPPSSRVGIDDVTEYFLVGSFVSGSSPSAHSPSPADSGPLAPVDCAERAARPPSARRRAGPARTAHSTKSQPSGIRRHRVADGALALSLGAGRGWVWSTHARTLGRGG